MGIYIKGMKMPISWEDCEFSNEFGECKLDKDYTVCAFARMGNGCPIIELPPHGRLIDADALHYSRVAIWHHDETVPMGGYVGGMNAVVMSAEIHNAPTIIPADKEEP